MFFKRFGFDFLDTSNFQKQNKMKKKQDSKNCPERLRMLGRLKKNLKRFDRIQQDLTGYDRIQYDSTGFGMI